jgi:FAD:protein FMN transferase
VTASRAATVRERSELAPAARVTGQKLVGGRLLVFAVLTADLVFAAAPLERFEAVEPHMGTLFRIELYATSREQAAAAFQAAFARIHDLDLIFSDYNPASEAMRLCRDSQGKPVRVSTDLFFVLEASKRLSEASGGAFDVTAAPAIRLWREDRRTRVLPTREALEKAQASRSWRDVVLDAADSRVTLEPGMLLDFGAIAKGFAADAALDVIRGQGIMSALVAASGDISAGDPPPGKPGWRVGLDWPHSAYSDRPQELWLKNAAVSTSGDTEQFVEIGGIRYSHIIDARTLQALTRRVTVSVISRRGVDADPLATTLSILDPQAGLALLERYPGSAALITVLEPGKRSRAIRSASWPVDSFGDN